ncbi:signal recognition particle receptor subunit alpha-like, partial [Trifolium medium]|nr:signal recognition particle receptor subunit alpha-like [Trifolium medium]
DIGEVQRTPIRNVPTQMSEPSDCGQPETVLPRRGPPPKPPDLGDSKNGKGHQKTEANLHVVISEDEKNLEKVRAKQIKGNSHIPVQWTEGELLYLPCGLDSLLIVIGDVKVLDVLRMSTYVIAKCQYKDVKALELLQMLIYAIAKWAFTCEYAWHPLFPPLQVGNSNLIRIDCWIKQHNNRVILSTCDTIQPGAIKQLWALANIFRRYVLKKGYAKDLAVVAKEAFQQAFHNGLDVVLVDIADRRHDYEPLMHALLRYEYFICDNMLESNSSPKGMDKIVYQPMLVKKLITPTMDKETPHDILIIDKYNEPSYVKRLKLKMMTSVANESNTCEMMTKLCEYAINVDISIARESIWVVVKMPLPAGLNEVWRMDDENDETMDIRRNEQREVEVLVKGRRLHTFKNSWEPVTKVHREFSGFLLEDKESFERGGNDRIGEVYVRKG